MKEKIAMFMFTSNGSVQYWDQGEWHGMVLAPNRELAKKAKTWFRKRQKTQVAIAEIGTAPGENVGSHYAASMKEGANCAFIIRDVTDERGIIASIKELRAAQ
jgi:hypothetical protein